MESPKARFLKSTHAKQFNDLTQSPIWDEACDVAMLQYVYGCHHSNDAESAAARDFQRQGAQRFLHILRNIGKPDEAPSREQIGQLKPTA